MTRVSENQQVRSLMVSLQGNRKLINQYSNEVGTGIKVNNPSDSNYSGSVAQFKQSLEKTEQYKDRVSAVKGFLTFQDDAVSQASDLVLRLQEIAEQSANETNSATVRAQMAAEAFAIRDHLASLANSTYQGRYVFGGADDDDPPYDPLTYTNSSSTASGQRYVYDSDPGNNGTRVVQVSDDVSIDTLIPGSRIFDNAIQASERLGRALEGFDTTPAPPAAPNGGGAAYVFPADAQLQSQAIRDSLTQLKTARDVDLQPQRTTIAGKLRRLDTASSLLELSKSAGEDVLSRLQDADVFESASKLAQAQTALQASMQVTTRILNISILDFI